MTTVEVSSSGSNASNIRYAYQAVIEDQEYGTEWYVNQYDVEKFKEWIQNAVKDTRVSYVVYSVKECVTYVGKQPTSYHAVAYVQYFRPVCKNVVKRLTGYNKSNPICCYDVAGAISFIKSSEDEVEPPLEFGSWVPTKVLEGVEPFDGKTMGVPVQVVKKKPSYGSTWSGQSTSKMNHIPYVTPAKRGVLQFHNLTPKTYHDVTRKPRRS